MLENFFDKILEEKEGIEEKIEEEKEEREKGKKIGWRGVILALFILILALAPRLYYLFFVSGTQNAGVGWFGDTYHHWQIAYLTKTTGLKHGFLRLWDLKGMEYFWGLLHPLILMSLMALTGSVDIVLTRILSIIAGSLAVVILYVVCNRYWGKKVAWAAVIFASLNPVGVFNDASGMVEPLGILMLLCGIYFWPKKASLTGLFWALSAACRAEYWLFGVGLIIAIALLEKNFDRKITLILGYAVPIGLYMKYLLDKTGNPIYPLWWNYLGNAAGRWQADIPLTEEQQTAQIIFIAMAVISGLGIIKTLIKKPPGFLFHLLGLGNFFFLGAFIGLTAYMRSYLDYFWVVRIFILPYVYLGVLVSIFLFVLLPKIWRGFDRFKIGWLGVIAVLLVSQISWRLIWHWFEPTAKYWQMEKEIGLMVGDIYQGGRILIHEGDPVMTYALVRFGGIKGENLVSQMYDPMTYMEEPFENWEENRQKIYDWLKNDDIRLIIVHENRPRYLELIRREPRWFNYLGKIYFGMDLYEVRI